MSIGVVREQRALPPVSIEAPVPSEPLTAASSAEGRSVFAGVLQGLGQEVRRGEGLVRTAVNATRGGHDIGPAELIALQAGVYRYGEAIDLASRLIDRATSSVKTVLQGQ